MITSNVPRVGHAMKEIAVPLFYLFVWDVAVTIFYFKVTPNVRQIDLPFSLFGTAIALFVTLSVNAAYGRWWEARGLWGLMINASRNIAREALMFCDTTVPGAKAEIPRQIVRNQIAFVNVLRTALRGQDVAAEAKTYLDPDMLAALPEKVNKPNAILTRNAELMLQAHNAGMLDTYSRVQMEAVLVDIANAQGGMERIKNTPLPSQYRFFPPFFARIFCVILPFAVVQDLGLYTPVGSALVGLMFLMGVQIGRDLMDPFCNDIYDVPMTAMCRTVEIDLLQMLGEPAPPKLTAERGVLW